MSSILKEFVVEAAPADVWSAFRDVGEVHKHLAPGFVTDCRLDGQDRIVTFANGVVAREVIVDIDDKARRLVYSARSDRLLHHNASFQVVAEADGTSRVVWIADVLPNEITPVINAMMDQGCAAMRKTLSAK
jgi:carbon monoxide dehydrogenase subunit G